MLLPIHAPPQELGACAQQDLWWFFVFPLPEYLINSEKLRMHQCVYLFMSLKLIYLTFEK